MASKYAELFAALAAPFEPSEVKTRNQGGRQLSYITARTAQNRLDTVVGPENWRCAFRESDRGVVCTLQVRVDDEWIPKSDAGGYAHMETRDRASGEMVVDEENDVKTAYSDSFKRAAVMWGIGRYLYGDGGPIFGDFPRRVESPLSRPPAREPVGNGGEEHQPRRAQGGGERQYDGPPRSGRALFAWARGMEDNGHPGTIRWLNDWGKHHEIPGRIVDWTPGDVARAYEAITAPADASAEG